MFHALLLSLQLPFDAAVNITASVTTALLGSSFDYNINM